MCYRSAAAAGSGPGWVGLEAGPGEGGRAPAGGEGLVWLVWTPLEQEGWLSLEMIDKIGLLHFRIDPRRRLETETQFRMEACGNTPRFSFDGVSFLVGAIVRRFCKRNWFVNGSQKCNVSTWFFLDLRSE